MGAHGVTQPPPPVRPLAAVMLMTVLVAVSMVMTVAIIVVRAERGVHDVQHAPVNALPHIDKYQGRAVAN
jgi:hypothetical protein